MGSRGIRFRFRPGISEEYEMEILKAIALKITGRPNVNLQDSGYRWSLGWGNDWWMDKDLETGEFILAFRYGENKQKEMEALRTVLIWLLGLERYN